MEISNQAELNHGNIYQQGGDQTQFVYHVKIQNARLGNFFKSKEINRWEINNSFFQHLC